MIAWAAGEGAAIALRALVYLDLLLLAGLLLCARRTVPGDASAPVIAGLAGAGATLAIAQLAVTALAMTGGDTAVLDGPMLRFIAFETSAGLSAVARFLCLAVLAALACRTARSRVPHTALALAALAALAWTGHAGASEGAAGTLHRTADILHLTAASVWLGTLVLLFAALARSRMATGDLIAALRRFAVTGTVIVGTLIVTGAINLWAIAGTDTLPALAASDYGRVLGLKLLLFGAMLAFAGFNRWHLTPRLEAASRSAMGGLRASVTFETLLAMGVILAVALLGTLPPYG